MVNVSSVCYLGVTFDEKLLWHEHINNMKGKLRAAISCIAKLRRTTTTKTDKAVYSALFESYLRYGLLAYGAAFASSLSPLEIIQNICVRKIMLAQPRDPAEQLYKRAQILPLKHLYFRTLLYRLLIKDTQKEHI